MLVQQRFAQIKILQSTLFMALMTIQGYNHYFLRCALCKKLLNPPKRGGTLLL